MSRRNPVLNPFAVQTAASTAAGFGQYTAGTGETGTTTPIAGATDGPTSRITSYIRRLVVAAKTAGSTGWSALLPANRAPWAGVAGDVRRVAVWLRYTSPDGSPLAGTMRTGVYTSAGAAGAFADSAPITLPSGQWVLVEQTVTATGAFASVGWWFIHTSARIAIAGSTLDATGSIGGEGASFAGSLPATTDWTYTWEGAANASASLEAPTQGLRVEPFVDAPVPRVGITLTGLDAARLPSRVTLFRSTAGGQRRVVRGWNRRQVYGSDYAIDYEAPLGRPVTYSLEVNTGAIVPLRTSDTVTLDVATGFIQDPLLPLDAVPLTGTRREAGAQLRATSLQNLEYAIGADLVQVLGSREPIALTGQRMAASRLDFSVLTKAAEQATALRNLLAESALVLVRPLPSWGPLPDLIYTVHRVAEELVDVSWGGSMTRWTITGDSVRPPSIDVLVALWTYDQVAALWSTYDQAQAAATASAARYLDVQRDPTMGV